MVSDLIDRNFGQWKEDLADSVFWSDEAEIIKSIPLGYSSSRDKFVWHYTKSGHFNVRSAYHLAMNQNLIDDSSIPMLVESSSNHNSVWLKFGT